MVRVTRPWAALEALSIPSHPRRPRHSRRESGGRARLPSIPPQGRGARRAGGAGPRGHVPRRRRPLQPPRARPGSGPGHGGSDMSPEPEPEPPPARARSAKEEQQEEEEPPPPPPSQPSWEGGGGARWGGCIMLVKRVGLTACGCGAVSAGWERRLRGGGGCVRILPAPSAAVRCGLGRAARPEGPAPPRCPPRRFPQRPAPGWMPCGSWGAVVALPCLALPVPDSPGTFVVSLSRAE